MEVLMDAFWSNLGDILKKKGINYSQFADKLGINRRTFEGYRSKQILPKIDFAMQMANALGIRMDELCDPNLIVEHNQVVKAFSSYAVFIPMLTMRNGSATIATGDGSHLAFPKSALEGMEIEGMRSFVVDDDSMSGSGIHQGDAIVLHANKNTGNGVYAIQEGDRITVRKLLFPIASRTVKIMCDKYTKDVPASELIILGKAILYLARI